MEKVEVDTLKVCVTTMEIVEGSYNMVQERDEREQSKTRYVDTQK